jgi:hypothetical protein
VSRERKGHLIVDNMTRDDDMIGGKIEAPVALVIGGIAKEGA